MVQRLPFQKTRIITCWGTSESFFQLHYDTIISDIYYDCYDAIWRIPSHLLLNVEYLQCKVTDRVLNTTEAELEQKNRAMFEDIVFRK